MFRYITSDGLYRGLCLKRRSHAFRFLCTSHSHRHSNPQTILRALSPDTVTQLKLYGYAVQDNMFDQSSSSHLRGEIDHLISNDFMSPNKTHILHRHPHKSPSLQTYAKRSVIQAEVPHLPSSVSVPYLRTLNDDPSLAAYLNVFWPKLTIRDQAVKVQRATGRDGCFPIHIDSSPEADHRIVTALLYPNESWCHDGGALRIYNTPISHVDIAPIPGRLVLLSSTLMHHRVLPAEHHRLAITLWLSGTLQRVQTPPISTNCVRKQMAHTLLQPKYRDFVFRLALQHEWEISLNESHAPQHAKLLVQQFRNNVEAIRTRLADAMCTELRVTHASARLQIQEGLQSQQSVMQSYEQLQQHLGGIPFVW